MKRASWMVLACAAVALGSASCGGKDTGGGDATSTSGTGPQPQPETGSQFSVDAQGGVFTAEDGFKIEVPPGAVSEATVITVERVDEPRDGAVGPTYVLGPEGQTFDKPITLTLPITVALEAALGQDTVLDARGFIAQEGSGDFAPLERHDVSGDNVITETNRLSSVYAGMTPPTVMADQHSYPMALAADDTYLYFASGGTEESAPEDKNDGYIFRVKPGTSAPEAMTPADPDPTALWVNDSHVYWASGGDNDPVIPSAIRRVDKASLEVETLVEIGYLLSLTGDASALYFGDGDGHNLYKMALDGGEPVVLATDAGAPEHLAQDAENIYWTGGLSTNKVYKVAKSGGEVTVLAENEAEPAGIAVDAEFVYWANTGDGGVFKAPIAGGEKTLVYQGGSMAGLALRGSTLFSTDQSQNRSVQAHDLASSKTVVIALGQHFAWRVIAPEGQDVFWSSGGDYRYEGQVVSYHAP
ncbi:hypothetical protein BE17_18445 [Sorangium cellulosum]|uniref:ZU5 domain-containing protein n=1 Tax=Sorangium cellulosum TaxID=56 RepID=A0A150QV09_SORCE|nr:hypothetical protein BE17_18445 [Sorangium cellulosum]